MGNSTRHRRTVRLRPMFLALFMITCLSLRRKPVVSAYLSCDRGCLGSCCLLLSDRHWRLRHAATTLPHTNKDPLVLFNSDGANQEEDVTYYSPNVPLKDHDTRYDNNDNDASADRNEHTPDEYSFFDQAIIYVRAGSGGQGANTYKKITTSTGGGQQGPPDGGNGGKGGNVVLVVDPSLNTLAGLTNTPRFLQRPNAMGGSGAAAKKKKTTIMSTNTVKSFRAENGSDGERRLRNGKNGKDVVIRVPPGTIVQEQLITTTDNETTTTKWTAADTAASLLNSDDQLIVARGGAGGEGTGVLKKSGRGVKRPRAPAKGGERKTLQLTLKLLADVALVGVPNAGKSTFLAAVTRAKPKIANYPFTTVIPNLGVWIPQQEQQKSDDMKGAGSQGLVLCDVPGLVAGAARGVGLGHAFLRHIERCHVILHLIDATSDDPVADYEMLNREMLQYASSSNLANKPQVVVINKVDVFSENSQAREEWEEGLQPKWSREELEERLRAVMPHTRLMWMSAKERDGVDDLMTRLAAFVNKVKEADGE